MAATPDLHSVGSSRRCMSLYIAYHTSLFFDRLPLLGPPTPRGPRDCDGPNTTTNGMQNQLRIVVNWYAKYKENQTKKKK